MATSICEYLVSAAIGQNCADPTVPGLERRGVIINRSDIDFSGVTFDATNTNVITALPLVTGKKGFYIYQPANNPFNGTNKAFAAGTYVNTFTKQVNFVVLDDSPEVAANIIDQLANGDFVVILENKYKALKATKPGWSAFELYGFDNGLKQTEGTNAKSGDDATGGWAVTLQETLAPDSAMYIYTTSYAATKTLVESLTAPAT